MGKIILRWIIGKWDFWTWTGSILFSIEQFLGTFESGNEPSGTKKCGEFLDYQRTG